MVPTATIFHTLLTVVVNFSLTFHQEFVILDQKLFIVKIMSTLQLDCVAAGKLIIKNHIIQLYGVRQMDLTPDQCPFQWWVFEGVASQKAIHLKVGLELVEDLQTQV
jgi:hypothetical protein